MAKTRRLFIEITSNDNIDNDKIYIVLKKNFPHSLIKLYSAEHIYIKGVR